MAETRHERNTQEQFHPSEEKKSSLAELAFESTFAAWANGRPDSIELDALKLVAWDFFKEGLQQGMNLAVPTFYKAIQAIQDERERILVGRGDGRTYVSKGCVRA